ncbi:MAG TPA: DMT family transporter [Accumulibacter sp.]|nr:DMT family transporter [Accumulibacter sp.]HQC81157.1 DMT family transporter [Accumulibacter sp.]
MIAHSVSSSRRIGVVAIVASAAGFGAMPIFGKIAYAEGVDLPSMLFFRFVLAGGLMAVFMHLRRLPWPSGRNLLALLGMGAVGYVGQSFCYFSALRHASAGLTALLLYLYPALVTVIAALLARRGLSWPRVAAVFAALIGTALAVGGRLDGSALGIVLGVGAALIYSIYILVGERVTPRAGAIPAATVIMLAAAMVYGAMMFEAGSALPSSPKAWLALGGIAFFSTAVAIIAFFAGMARLGAADAATLSTLEPVVTIVLAALCLREAISAWQIVGGAVILGAVIVLARAGEGGH